MPEAAPLVFVGRHGGGTLSTAEMGWRMAIGTRNAVARRKPPLGWPALSRSPHRAVRPRKDAAPALQSTRFHAVADAAGSRAAEGSD